MLSFSQYILLESQTIHQALRNSNVNIHTKQNINKMIEHSISNSKTKSILVNYFCYFFIIKEGIYDLRKYWNDIKEFVVHNQNNNKIISQFNNTEYVPPFALSDSTKFKMLNYGNGKIGRTIIDGSKFNMPGWKWLSLDCSKSDYEAASGAHCGESDGNNLLSLRDPKNQVHLTFVVDKNKILDNGRGKGNTKPTKKYHDAIVALLLSPEIRRISSTVQNTDDSSLDPEDDWVMLSSSMFKFSDLARTDQQKILSLKPDILKQ